MAEVLTEAELVEEPSDYGSLAPGTRLGRYELLVPVARGGMARVWAARLHGQRGFQKLVALKTILPHLAREKQFERMFLDEARIASRVHHPNVCEIYELGEESHHLYLAMEWVSGDSLARLLRSTGTPEALDARVIARIVADACAGAHAAHELTDDDGKSLGVVHRDLSPHNILLTTDGVAKVADFGVAKALGQLHDATSAGQLKGKLAYMAPEQITGGAVDRRSDVFSLGCVLYEATTGHRPFRGDGDHQVMHAVLKGEFPPPGQLVRGYPQELERIVQRALSPQAILRFPTAERMRFALEEFLARGPLVTQSNVAQLLRQRLGQSLEKRRERIRQASTVGDRERGWSEPPGGHTPSADAANRSGVKQARPLYTTMALDGSELRRTGGTAPPPNFDPPTVRDTATPAPGMGPAIPGAPPVPGGMGAPYTGPSGPATMPVEPSWHGASAPPMPMPMPMASGVAPVGGHTVPPAMHSHPPPAFQPYGGPHYARTPSHGPHPGYYPPVPPHAGASQAMPAQPGRDGPPSQPPATTGQYAVAIVIGLVAAALIGAGGFFAWQRQRDEAAHAAATAATSSSVAAAPSGAVGDAKGELVFEVPDGATVVVDGKELPPGTRSIPRPNPGATLTVVVRAPGKKDETRMVDYFSPSPLSIVLEDAKAGVIEVGDGPQDEPEAKPADVKPSDVKPSDVKIEPRPVDTSRPEPTREPKPTTGPAVAPGGTTRPRTPTKGDPPIPANPY